MKVMAVSLSPHLFRTQGAVVEVNAACLALCGRNGEPKAQLSVADLVAVDLTGDFVSACLSSQDFVRVPLASSGRRSLTPLA